jgi:MFS family permease
MGTTMNHIAAVTVPFGGAWLWERFHNYQVPFWVGVVIAAISLFATRWLPHGPVPKTSDPNKETLDASTTTPVVVTAAEHAA